MINNALLIHNNIKILINIGTLLLRQILFVNKYHYQYEYYYKEKNIK